LKEPVRLIRAGLERKSPSSADDAFVLLPKESKDEDSVLPEAKMTESKMLGKPSKGLSLPPMIDLTPVVKRHVFRYVSASGGVATVTYNSVIGACGGICTATNSIIRPWASSFKLHRVTIWPGVSTTGVETCNLEWASASNYEKDAFKDRTVPQGVTSSSALSFVPPKESSAAFWNTGGSNALCFITTSPGSVVDVELTFTISASQSNPTQTIATGVLSQPYYLYLDGSTAHTLKPSALQSTF